MEIKLKTQNMSLMITVPNHVPDTESYSQGDAFASKY